MKWFKQSSMGDVLIPRREESRYFGQYEGTVDVDRLIQILQESGKIAVESRNPDTANGRYELAIEAYHQLKTLKLRRQLQNSVDNAMQTVVRLFPSQVCINEALGLCDKANKVKTVKTQLKYLEKAKEVLETGLARQDAGYESILSIYSQVDIYIEKANESESNQV